MQGELTEQLNQYCLQLLSISELVDRQPPQPHLRVLRERLELQIRQMKAAGQQLVSKQLTPGVLTQMGTYFKQCFITIIKQTHRLVQVRPTQDGQNRLKDKVSVIREMEEEMGSVWEAGKEQFKGDGVLRRLSGNISTLAAQLDQGQLRSVAREYLQKEFLAIRVIAYRLYEQYVGHTHSKTKQLLQDLRNEHELLKTQVGELKEMSHQLKSEEKRMMRQLNELKRVNDLIGKRYFVRSDTQIQNISQ